MVICLERGANDWHMVPLIIPLPPHRLCFRMVHPSGTGSPRWSQTKGLKLVIVVIMILVISKLQCQPWYYGIGKAA